MSVFNINGAIDLATCIHNCNKCPLRSQIDRPPITFSGGQIPILLVTDSPGVEEYNNNQIFYSKAGAYLSNCLIQAGFDDPGSFMRTSSIKCHQMVFDQTFEGNTPQQALDCGDWLDKEIEVLKPKVIVAFGNIGVYRFSDDYQNKTFKSKKDGTPQKITGIADKNGLIEWSSRYNCWVMYLLAPSYIERNKSKEQSYVDALRQLKTLYDNNFTPPARQTNYYAIYPKPGEDKQRFLEEARNFLNWIKTQPEYAVDIETTGLDYMSDEILLVSYSWAEGCSATLFWDDELWPEFKETLENASSKTMHNGKFDSHFFHERNIEPEMFDFDTMIAGHQIDENAPLGLGFLTTRYLGLDGDYKSKFWGDTKDKKIVLDTEGDILRACEYANKDTDYTLRLKRIFVQKLIELGLYPDPNEPNARAIYLFSDIAMPLNRVLLEIEKNGLGFDTEYQDILKDVLEQDAKAIYQKAEELLYSHLYPNQNHTLQQLISYLEVFYTNTIEEVKKHSHLGFNPSFFSLVQEYSSNIQKYIMTCNDLISKKLVSIEFKQELAELNKQLFFVEKTEQTMDDILLEGFSDQPITKPKKKNIKSGALSKLSNIKTAIKRKSVDTEPFEELLKEFHNIYENLDNLSGIKMNINSPDQMSKILYEILGLPIYKYTESQKPSTDKETIELLSKEHEFPRLITEFRGITHDISNYIVGVREAVREDGYVHADFSQTRAVTGRLACSKPALHGIKRDFRIRNQFTPDYSTLFIECVEENTLIQTDRGLVKIKDVQVGDEALTHKNRYMDVDRVINRGLKDCYEVATDTGLKVVTTNNHPFYVMNENGFEWKKLCDINIESDRLLSHDKPLTDLQDCEIDEDDAYVIGFLFGDGCYGLYNTKYTNKRTNKVIEGKMYGTHFALGLDTQNLIHKFEKYFKDKHKTRFRVRDLKKGDCVVQSKNLITNWMKDYPKKGSHSLRVPVKILNSPENIRKAFLAGVVDSDGSYHSRRMSICSVSELFIDDLMVLCRSIGVHGVKRTTLIKQGYNSTPEDPTISYNLDVFEKESLERLPDGWLDRKRELKYKMLNKTFSQCRTARHAENSLKSYHKVGIQGNCSIPILRVFQNSKRNGFVYRVAIKNAIEKCFDKAKHMQPLLDYRSSAITSITPVGLRETYDLEVDTDNSFTANSVIVHNCDVSQCEVRMLAALSDDENLKAVFQNRDSDVHTENARKIFKLAASTKPTKEQRSQTKRIVFAIIYGSEIKSVAEDLKITIKEAEALFNAFYDAYPKTKEWMDNSIKECKEKGYVTNYFGRRRRLPDINSQNKWERREAERQSINAPVQSSASADYVALAHINLEKTIQSKYKGKVSVQQRHNQHDMLLIQAPIQYIKEVQKDVQDALENAYPTLGVPIVADADIVNCWAGCAMTDDDVDVYAIEEKLGLLPIYGYCNYEAPIKDSDDNITGYKKPCGVMFKPFSFSRSKCCPDHHKAGYVFNSEIKDYTPTSYKG